MKINIKTKLKNIIAGLMIFGITFSTPFAVPVQAAGAESMTKIFSLDTLIAEVMNTNPEIKLLDNQLVTQEKRYKNAVDNAESQKLYDENPGKDIAETKRNILLYPLQVKNRLEQLKWEKNNKVMTMKADASKLYYQYIFKQYEIESQGKSVERAKIELTVEQEKVKLGKLSSLSLGQSENAVDLANQKLGKLNAELTAIEMKINSLLNYDLEQKIQFNSETVKIDEYTINDKNIEALTEKRKLESNSIAQLQRQIEEAKIDSYAGSYTRGNTGSNYEMLQDKPKELENQIEIEKYNIEQKIRTDYTKILNLYDNISISKLQYDLSAKLFDVADKKYKQEMISYVDYLKAAEDKENAMIQYDQAQLSYLTAVLDFKLYTEQLV
ncbi:TolC family protein [Ruminiclostridium cellobioparum]|uniref:Outer membrane protein n=1 Tax=Ruminiclostridium cellobioparum subsp. termitidis CT1112 TaxID=1195236 RepID=S0FGR4_RUMCE|nr:TolC family protein [Ruminiclostridium cellobioparum]EMS70367.1 Outer membrane protein [Ruminiclostridium cellobioparum subsp. termitidis CT1112]